eukprot:274651-Pleurochrysis_carterae.AAC.2
MAVEIGCTTWSKQLAREIDQRFWPEKGACHPPRHDGDQSAASHAPESFVREKWRQPKKPLLAESGLGCAAQSTWCACARSQEKGGKSTHPRTRERLII